MKGVIFEEHVQHGLMDILHRGGNMERRIHLPQAGITVTPHEYHIVVTDVPRPESCAPIGEVEVPDECIPLLQSLQTTQLRANKLAEPLHALVHIAVSKAA